jgi:hypothetical protein
MPPESAPRPSLLESPLALAATKATLGAALLAGIFLLIPGSWNWRITLAVAGGFWAITFVLSLLTSWAKALVMARFAPDETPGA